jgi:hypothetical protein
VTDDFNNNPDWLGRGWAFPPEFDLRSRGVSLVSAAEDIAQSLEILLSTAPGERVMNPSYGCGLRSLVFENISETTITQVRDTIDRAVLFFEPRINLDLVTVDVAEVYRGLLRIQLNYTIKSTNSRSNMVYPFYFQEGTSIPSQPA